MVADGLTRVDPQEKPVAAPAQSVAPDFTANSLNRWLLLIEP